MTLSFTASAQAQDLEYARRMVDNLTSAKYWGRGYTNDGMSKAADFLVDQLKQRSIEPLDGKNYKQNFSMAVNTFPSKMSASINGIALTPGIQFIVGPQSKGQKVSGTLTQIDETHFADLSHSVMFTIEEKLTSAIRPTTDGITLVKLLKSNLPAIPRTYEIDIENVLLPEFQASNVTAMVKGTTNPNQYVVMTAHYDHLGGMGADTYFPGANDNASGTAVLLDLVQYYAKNPQPYTMVFLFFGAEEGGLVGSKYFVEHPLIDLKKIRFLMNLDLMGNGDQGATIVNATEFKPEFDLLRKINEIGALLPLIQERGKAPNSDHYWFSEAGVPAFFMYTLGGPPHYHDVNDKAVNLQFSRYNNVFKLLTQFNSALMK